jgi:hypothetical protein
MKDATSSVTNLLEPHISAVSSGMDFCFLQRQGLGGTFCVL